MYVMYIMRVGVYVCFVRMCKLCVYVVNDLCFKHVLYVCTLWYVCYVCMYVCS